MIKYEIKKTGACDNAKCPTPKKGEWNESRDWFDKYKSLPAHYTVEGTFIRPPKEGESFVVDRTMRNGIECRGCMTSSTIQELETAKDGSMLIKTANSWYTATPITS